MSDADLLIGKGRENMADAEPRMPAAGRGGRDLIGGPIGSTLLLFALPTLASNILQTLNGSINAVWVGRFLGPEALAATANANLVMFLMYSALFGFGMAATILVGQNVGRGDLRGARAALGTAAGAFTGLSLVIAVAGWFATPALLRLLGTPEGVFPLALDYLRVIFLSMPASFLTVLLMMGLRGFGDSLTPLWFMGLSTLLDAALNPVLILGLGPLPAMGIAGSATATLVAAALSLAAMIAYIYARDLPLRLRGAEFRLLRPDPALLRSMFAKGAPMGLQMIVVSVSGLAMIGLVNREGIATVAAYGAINQLWAYVQMPALAIGAAVSAMAAQNIGAGRWDRVARITRNGVLLNLALTGALVALVWLVERHALGLFGIGSEAVEIAARIHRLAGWSWVLFGATLVLSATMRANGAVLVPLAILAIAMFPVRLGFAAALQPVLGADAIWWSFPAGTVATLAMSWTYYRVGGWRATRLVDAVAAEEAGDRTLADGDACGKLAPAS